MLSDHAPPGRREAALTALKKMRALTPDAMWRAAHKNLQDAVKLAGPYTDDRMTALRTGVEIFRRSPNLPAVIRGPEPEARRALEGLPRLGESGSDRMLLFAAGHPVLPVDARLNRVARRLGYGRAETDFRQSARSVQQALAAQLPPEVDRFRVTFLYLSHHGAATCTEANPHCQVCPLLADCPEGTSRLSSSMRRDA